MNLIQLVNGIVITIDNEQFKHMLKKYKSLFHLSRFITVIDTRKHKITIRKKDIILFEESFT
jgi:hypothetical protein